MIKSEEGGAGLLHKKNQANNVERRSADTEEEEEDARLLDRCEAKRKNGQSFGSVTKVCKMWSTSLGKMRN